MFVKLPFMPIDKNMPKMNGGSSGITNLLITRIITRSRSFAPAYSVSLFTAVMATPMVNASSRAVITSNGGFISMSKNGLSAPSSTVFALKRSSPFSNHGYPTDAVPKAIRPEKIVEPYATPVVIANHLPAPRPRPEIAGVIRAKMSTGMKKLRKLLNRLLYVTNTRASQSGKNSEQTMPAMMAMMICHNRLPRMRWPMDFLGLVVVSSGVLVLLVPLAAPVPLISPCDAPVVADD